MPALPTDIPIASAGDPALNVCPSCGGKTRLVPDDRFRWVCGACGTARVPSPDERAHSAAEKEHLLRSTALVRQAHLIGLGATFTGMAATGAAVFAMLTIFAAHMTGLVPIMLIAASGVMSMLTLMFGRSARARIEDAKAQVTEAWQLVVEGLMRIHARPLTAAEIGTMMNTSEADADRLLTLLSVEDKVTSTVGNEDAQIRYSLPTQLRVEDPLATAATVLAPRVEDSAEERELAAEIEAASAKAAQTEHK